MEIQSLKNFFEKQTGYADVCKLIKLINSQGYEAYMVGGAVRDALFGQKIKDYDLCTNAHPQKLLKIFKNYKVLTHGIDFGTLTVVLEFGSIEITTYRGESGYVDGRHPENLDFNVSLVEDLKRRDFTINTLVYHPAEGLIDKLKAIEDLKNKTIKTVGDPAQRFNEDHLRILRMIRFSLNYDLKIEKRTYHAAIKLKENVLSLSKERVFNELQKTLLSKNLNILKIQQFSQDFLKKTIVFDFNLDSEFHKLALLYLVFGDSIESYLLSKNLKKDFSLFTKKPNFKTLLSYIEQNELYGDQFVMVISILEKVHEGLEISSSDVGLKKYSTEIKKEISNKNQSLYKGINIGEHIEQDKKAFIKKGFL